MPLRFSSQLTLLRQQVFDELSRRLDAALKPAGGVGKIRCEGEKEIGPKEIEEAGFESGDFRWLCLRIHYRLPLKFSWSALEAARTERLGFLGYFRSLESRKVPAANSTGLHAYKRRFNEALEGDFNTPAALAALGDSLRPGALSPGSQLEMLKIANSILGIDTP